LAFEGGWITPKGLGGGSATPRSAVWGGRNHLQALGGGPATPKRLRNQKQKQNKKVWVLGVAGSPLKALGVARPYGVVETSPRPLGVVRPPLKGLETKNKIKKKFEFWG